MRFFSLDRAFMVVACFVLWIGAAGLVCWMLVPRQVPDEPMAVTNPVSVVRAQSIAASASGAPVMMAQR